jgi:Mg2+-importing ATPase
VVLKSRRTKNGAGTENGQPELFADLSEAAHADITSVFTRLRTAVVGISWAEASHRLEQLGPNEVAAQRAPSWPAVLWHSAKNPFNGVLLLLGVVSFLTRDREAAAVMAVMVILSTGLRFWQELKSLIQAESLRKLVRNKVTVLRTENTAVPDREASSFDHRASDIPIERLVPGDMVPGDLRLLESRDLFVTQSALTGEAMPVEKVEGERR